MTNLEIAALLRNIAAAYQILGENRFKIIAYERAADSIEHLSSDIKDLWDDGKLDDIPGVGETLKKHLDDLIRTGKVSHFDQVLRKVPQSVFPLLLVPGIGPKRAYMLVSALHLDNAGTVVADLKKMALAHKVAILPGFGEKSETDILENIKTYEGGQIKENRMDLPSADAIAVEIITHLKQISEVQHVHPLGSLRRQVSTIGDIDIAVSTTKPEKVIDHFLKYPYKKLIERGSTGASVLLHNGRQVDVRVQRPQAYGAMLQYFTGSKNHNIKLRAYALNKGLSLSEHGIKNVKTDTVRTYETEDAFYHALGLTCIPPEMREDKGEIEKAGLELQGTSKGLPTLVNASDIQGDLHIHSDYDLEPSHDLGRNTVHEYLDVALKNNYEYIGFSDHNPSFGNHTEKQIIAIMKDRKAYYEQQYDSWIQNVFNKNEVNKRVHMFLMCEVDIQPDGNLALPTEAFAYVDAVIASIHSSFTQDKSTMTKRILTALQKHPKVRMFGHPTARLLGKREGINFDWNEIFSVCASKDIALEINAHPMRLDTPDSVVYDAIRRGIRFCINTDSHATDQMELIKYGVSVARRGWATSNDILNTMEYNRFNKWLKQ